MSTKRLAGACPRKTRPALRGLAGLCDSCYCADGPGLLGPFSPAWGSRHSRATRAGQGRGNSQDSSNPGALSPEHPVDRSRYPSVSRSLGGHCATSHGGTCQGVPDGGVVAPGLKRAWTRRTLLRRASLTFGGTLPSSAPIASRSSSRSPGLKSCNWRSPASSSGVKSWESIPITVFLQNLRPRGLHLHPRYIAPCTLL